MHEAPDLVKQEHTQKHLPDFARFLLKEHYHGFLRESLQHLLDLRVPLLTPLNAAEAEALSNKSAHELLIAVSEGNPSAHIEKSIERWRTNQFPKVKHNQTVIDDVMLIAHSRKLVFMKFIPLYTADPEKIIALVKEIECYIIQYTATTLKSFVEIIDERINDQLQQLEQSEQLYRQAETIANIGNWKWDIKLNKVQWTDGLYRIYGLEPHSEEIDLERYLSFAYPDDKEMMVSIITESVEKKKKFEFFHRIVSNDKKIKIIHSRGNVRMDEHGNVVQLVGSAQDVTTQKLIENQLIENQQILLHRTQELQESNASLEEFAYVASHDLKEPLRKISIFIDRLKTLREKGTPKEKQYLDNILNSTQRMQHMIDDLLSLSLLSADKTPEQYSLKKLLNEVLHTFDNKLEEMKAVVRSDNLPEANVIPAQFKQVFQNLISNSLKFVREGAAPEIIITHQYLSAKEVSHHNLPSAPRYLEIRFEDNGIGFDNAFADKIFAVFQRLHHKNEYEGTGIGLAICRKIIKNHGGVIVASGAVGKGAVFSIILPAR